MFAADPNNLQIISGESCNSENKIRTTEALRAMGRRKIKTARSVIALLLD